MFNPSREQVRRFFCDAWKKHLDRLPLVGAEVTAADIAQRHPEYHALLADADAAQLNLLEIGVHPELVERNQ